MTATNQIIQVGSAHVNLSPYGFQMWAGDFLAAARASTPPPRNGCLVLYFLYCQSIELGLKAFLLYKGILKKTLKTKPYGHRLDNLLTECRRLGYDGFVAITSQDEDQIRIATDWYATGRRFQYFDVYTALSGFKGLPTLDALADIASRIHTEEMTKFYLDNA